MADCTSVATPVDGSQLLPPCKHAMIVVLQRRRDAGEDTEDPLAALRALEGAGYAHDDVREQFGSLGRLERAAGIITIPPDEFRHLDTLMADVQRVARALKRAPGRGEYEALGRYSEKALRRRVKTSQWSVVLRAFGRYLLKNHATHLLPPGELARIGVGETAAASADCRPDPALEGRPERSRCSAAMGSAAARPPRRIEPPVFGAPLLCEGFINVPVNEQSTLALFCCLASRLHIAIRYVDSARYPDIWALQRVPGREDRWREVRIEVQFRARDFVRDGHDANEVDILVCFEDNWPDRPAHLELIELRRVLQDLRAAGGAA